MSDTARLLGLALLTSVLSWPLAGDLHTILDLDGDWQIALQVAVRQGLDFGPDVLFTYGPLGFLHVPVFVDAALTRVAFGYTFLIHTGVCLVVLRELRRSFDSWLLGALGALVVGALIYEGAPVVIAFAGAAALLTGRAGLRVAAGLGALAGLGLLIKLNTGVALTGLAVIAIATAPAARGRLAGVAATGLLVALAAGWAATGQSLGGAGDYLTGGVEIVSGYSEAMVFVDPDLGAGAGEYAAALAIAALGAAVAWHTARSLSARGRAGLVLLWALLWFTAFKAAFVRPDALHVNIFFGTTLGALAVLGWSSTRRRTPILLGCALVLALGGSLARLPTGLPANFFEPWERAGDLVSQTATMTDGSRTAAAIAAGKRERVEAAHLSDMVRRAASRQPSHFDPYDAGLAWSHGLPWHPIPVFQSYSAYTPELDARNARALRDPDGPAAVLRRPLVSVDERNPAWESPAAMQALLCNFAPGLRDTYWILLERTAPRCGRPRPLGSTTVRYGHPARVPAAPRGSMVIARLDLGVHGLERLRTLLFRAQARYIALDGHRTYRVVPGTAQDGLLMGVDPAVDLPGFYGLGQDTSTLRVLRGGAGDEKVTIRYSAVPVRAPSRPASASR